MEEQICVLFEKSDPQVWEMYQMLLKKVEQFGEVRIEPKKTSIHWVSKSAFAGIHPKKQWLDITIVSDAPLDPERVKKTEQMSKSRYYNDLRLENENQIDKELINWLHAAYILRG